jgi:cytochrome c5
MKSRVKTMAAALTLICMGMMSANVFSEDANPKRGRVYFKMVCTVCHMTQAGKAIPPSSYTMAEWGSYIDADKHDLTGVSNPSVKYYTSQEYRKSIADSNKAAAKFLEESDAQMIADVRAFLISGAKDSDTPASCE